MKLYISIEPYLTLGLGSRGCQSMLVEVEVFFWVRQPKFVITFLFAHLQVIFGLLACCPVYYGVAFNLL